MKKRVAFYDLLKVIAIFGVIILHITANTTNTFQMSGISKSVFDAICKLMYFSVPIFVMISGALFLNPDKEISLKKLYSKYILRIFLALLIFGMIYSILESYYNVQAFYRAMVPEALKNIITGNLWAHMWYLYLIIGLYMITPLLKKFTANFEKGEYTYMIVILFVFTIILPDIAKIFKIDIAFDVSIFSPYIFFYMLGDYLSRFDISKKIKLANYLLSIIFIILIFINSFINIFDNGIVTYTSIMMSSIIISIFLLVKKKENYKDKTKILLENIGENVFGIYLLHQLVINIIYKALKIKFILDYPYIGLAVYTMIVFIISYFITYLLRKIKFVREYIL